VHCTKETQFPEKESKNKQMISLQPYKSCLQTTSVFSPSNLTNHRHTQTSLIAQRKIKVHRRNVKCNAEEKKSERRTFLTLEEAGLVEMSGLSTHERFLCRLTVLTFLSYVLGLCFFIGHFPYNVLAYVLNFHIVCVCRYLP